MSRALTLSTLLGAAVLSGCTYAPSVHAPHFAAPRELVLTYDEGYVLSAGGQPVAKGYAYEGLSSFVGCVPEAAAHARAAEANGAAVGPLQITGVSLSLGGLAGLSGIYYVDKNNAVAAGLLAGGFAVQLVGLLLVGIGAQAKVNANGHAVDAMNYYNDGGGSRGGACAAATRRSW